VVAYRVLQPFLRAYRRPLLAAALLSIAINLLMLTGSVFMLQVYDRVLTSGSLQTLVVLLMLAVVFFVFMAIFDAVRARLFVRLAQSIDGGIAPIASEQAIDGSSSADGNDPLRDLDVVRRFIGSPALATIFDLPWVGLYLLLLFALHPLFGVETIVGLVVLIALTVLADRRTRSPLTSAAQAASNRQKISTSAAVHADTVRALGMTQPVRARLTAEHQRFVDDSLQAQDSLDSIGASTKAIRLLFQSVVLATGAWLVIEGAATAGVIIAASVISARTLAPVEQTVAQWRSFSSVRQALLRLAPLLQRPERVMSQLPSPTAKLEVSNLGLVPAGSDKPVLQGISFTLRAGEAMGVIGPSGAGKTALARALVGLWVPAQGDIRLDDATLDQWSPDARGRWTGYLAHTASILPGTVAENIARFAEERDDAKVILAAKRAGAFEVALRLPKGLDTPIGAGGVALSAGQSQRVGLARAIYGDPFLIVLDEPNANLDAEGDAALAAAVRGMKERGAIAIVMAHRPSAIAEVDYLLYLREGRVVAFGPRDEVLKRITAPANPNLRTVTPVART
jgi:PrtD family type I secretion system ABC transporter